MGVAIVQRQSSRSRVLSRLVGQKRIREAFLHSPKAAVNTEANGDGGGGGSGDWITAETEVKHGQLDDVAEQIDFHDLVSLDYTDSLEYQNCSSDDCCYASNDTLTHGSQRSSSSFHIIIIIIIKIIITIQVETVIVIIIINIPTTGGHCAQVVQAMIPSSQIPWMRS
ncbi:uncharacterized protein LOC110180509 [Drosophila serrata]|uniref:uncharacterized protein LOC110180509 n=1 Tax=Drosophila serrata TaxID=7274 RepID=UPI000A1D1D47|nr:uncharacterized protein LOC110180509 [Drosophila serrata]